MIERNVCLLVLDSIAALAHRDHSRSIPDRQSLLAKICAVFKFLAESFSVPVVVSNHVTSGMRRTRSGETDEATVVAALGTLWAHGINTRLVMEDLGHVRSVCDWVDCGV